MARAALRDSLKLDSLQDKSPSDPRVQVRSPRNDIAPEYGRVPVRNGEAAAEIIVYFPGKEGNLTLVVFLEAKKAITDQPHASHTLHGTDRDHFVRTRFHPVMAEIIMSWRDINAHDGPVGFHGDNIPDVGLKIQPTVKS